MAKGLLSYLLMIGYGLSVVGYLIRISEGAPKVGIVIGMILIASAYGFMFSGKLADPADDETDTEEKRTVWDKVKDEWNSAEGLTTIGYAVASFFFIAIHLFPFLTFHVRYYDVFGAIGYGLSAAGMWLSHALLKVGLGVVVLYYIFGSYQKLKEEGWVDKLQLLSRSLLAVCYGVYAIVH